MRPVRFLPRASLLVLIAMLAALAPWAAAAQSPSPAASPAAPAIPVCVALGDPPVAEAPPPIADPVEPVGTLTVFGAASLRGAFEAFAPAVLAATGLEPEYAFDASSALRALIEEGSAPADVFASADTSNIETLLAAGLAVDPVAFTCNQLTVIVPAGNPAGITAAADLGRPGVKVAAAGEQVPITRYAVQVVDNLGISAEYEANIVSREDNVAAVRAKVELGEADAGIVYVTDAIASGDLVEQVAIPAEANVPATYAAAVVAGTDQPDEAAAFLAWLTGLDGQAYLASFGFLPAPAPVVVEAPAQ